MRHYNSVFHQLLKHIPWEEFDALVKQHRADVRARRLTTKSQFLAMLYGQLSGAASLREIVGGIEKREITEGTLDTSMELRQGVAFVIGQGLEIQDPLDGRGLQIRQFEDCAIGSFVHDCPG